MSTCNWLKFKIAKRLPVILKEFVDYTPILIRKTEGCQHVTGGSSRLQKITDHLRGICRIYPNLIKEN
jgi:hypothetical protein